MTFLEKYALLQRSIPRPAVYGGDDTHDCEYVDYVFRSSNTFYSFDSALLTNAIYCVECMGKNLVDCSFTVKSELCYECLYATECYNSLYLQDCNNCRDCWYCVFCVGCSDCFGCVGLTRKQYCIFNKEYSKEQYFKELKKLRKKNPSEITDQVRALKKTIPHAASNQYDNINCVYGDYLYHCKNVYWGFNTYAIEDCGYIYTGGLDTKQCWDMYFAGSTSELCYQMVDSRQCYNCMYVVGCKQATNCYHCMDLVNCSDCVGCVGLTNKKYCVLNNQLSKEEYKKVISKIKEELGWKL